MAFKTYNKERRFKDTATGEVFTAKRITDSSFSYWKGRGLKSEFQVFRRDNSIENYDNNNELGYNPFVNPNTKSFARFVETGENVTKTNTNTNTNSGMKNLNIEMGPVKGDQFKLTVMGTVAVKVDGGYSSFDPETGELTDVTGFTLDMDGMFYNMPSAEVSVGDLLRVKGGYAYVQEVKKNKVVAMLLDGEVKTLVSTKSPFGFNFYTKVVSIMDMGGSNGGLFGGEMNPMMLMMMSGNQSGSGSTNPFGGGDMMTMMMMSQMMGGEGMGGLFGGKKSKKKSDKSDKSDKGEK